MANKDFGTRWSADELAFLRNNYLKMNDTEIAEHLPGRTVSAILNKRWTLNLIKPEYIPILEKRRLEKEEAKPKLIVPDELTIESPRLKKKTIQEQVEEKLRLYGTYNNPKGRSTSLQTNHNRHTVSWI